jgi:cell division protein FtsL
MRPYRFFLNKPVSNEQLVRQVDRRRNRELWMAALTGLALAAALSGYAWQHFEMIRTGYRLEELRMEQERLKKAHRQLELERAALASPDRIESIATRQLGMAAPHSGQMLILEVGAAAPAGPQMSKDEPSQH